MIKPRALKIGDKVAVIAPSSATDLKSVDNGEERIKALGLNPVMFPTCYRNYGHLSATDEERAQDVNDAFMTIGDGSSWTLFTNDKILKKE